MSNRQDGHDVIVRRNLNVQHSDNRPLFVLIRVLSALIRGDPLSVTNLRG